MAVLAGREQERAFVGDVLIVEDDEGFAHSVVGPAFEDRWRLTYAYNVRQALAHVSVMPVLDLAIVDLNLPGGRPFSAEGDGGGFDVVDRIRRRYDRCHVVVLTAYLDARLVNAVTRRDAHYLVKSDVQDALAELAARPPISAPRTRVTPAGYAERLAANYNLTPREREVMEHLLCGLDRTSVAQELGSAPNTVKHQIRSILHKTGARRVAELREDMRCAMRDDVVAAVSSSDS